MSPLHPFVKAFFKKERSFLELVADFKHLNDPLIDALGQTYRDFNSPQAAQQMLKTLEKLPLANADYGLVILLYNLWIIIAVNQGHLIEAMALRRRQKSLLPPDAPPDLAAQVAGTEVYFADAAGDLDRAERILRELCEWKGLTPAFRTRQILGYLNLLAQQGRARDAQALLSSIDERTLDPGGRNQWYLYHCLNNVETGRVADAAQNLSLLKTDNELILPLSDSVSYCKTMLSLLQHSWSYGPLQMPAQSAEASAPAWAWSAYALQQRQVGLALAWAKRFAQRDLASFTGNNFAAFTLLRAHLVAGSHAAVQQVLNLRGQRKISHYLDDFFAARLEWRKGQHEKSAALLSLAMKAVAHYRAEGRLDFEFSLALEMTPSDVARLCRMAAEQRSAAVLAVKRHSSAQMPAIEDPDALVGTSPVMKKMKDMIRRFGPLPAPALITGETGTGKEMVARALHESSPRRKEPFIAVNCGAIAETLLESELFGHARGAFTGAEREHKGLFEEAGKGTLFLDEIGEITPRLQVALLRVLESGEIRAVGGNRARKMACRLIFATNVDLEASVEAGSFRRDLFYRLRRLHIHLPPLRERAADIPPLARHFLRLSAPGGPHARVSAELEGALERGHWAGNVRELRNEIERMVWLNPGRTEYGVGDLTDAAGISITPKEYSLNASASTAAGGNQDTENSAATAAEDEWRSKTTFRRLDRLRELFQQHEKLSRLEVTRLLHVSPNTAASYLNQLAEQGVVEKVEPAPHPRSHYYVAKRRVL